MSVLRIAPVVVASLGLLGLIGCDGDSPKTYPVEGKIELPGGEIGHLAGSTIEASLESDPAVRASGEIKPDGSFSLEILHKGVILKGAQEGSYRARILPADDDPATKRRAAKAFAAKYKQFDTSGLRFQVPANDAVKLTVTPK